MANPNPNIDPESQYLNPYERIWKTRDLSALDKPIELENNTSQFGRGINAFGKEMQATGYALAALGSQGLENVIGKNDVTSGITDWGLKGYKQATEEGHTGYNAPSVANVEDIKNASDFLDWGSYQLGKGLPMLGSLALSGGVGGAIGRLGVNAGVKELAGSAVGSVVKKGVEAGALKAAEGQVVTKAMQEAAAKVVRDRMVAGAVTGGFTGSFGLEGGQEFGELTDAGIAPKDAVAASIAVGGINGALEFLPFYKVAKDIGLGTYAKNGIREIIKTNPELSKKAIALAKEVGGRFLGGAAEGAVAEGVTEGLQELTSIAGLRWAKQDPLFADLSDDEWSRVKNSMAAGALVGGTAMGAGAMLKGPQKVGTSTDENQPTASSAGGASARPKTREQEIEELRNKINTELEAAIKSGNTARAEQLAGARDMIDMEVAPPVPVQDTPIQESPMQEAPVQEIPAKGQSLQDRINRELETIKGSTARAEELTNILNANREDLNQKAKNGEVISQEQEQGLQSLQEQINRELRTAANSTIRAKELSNIQEAPIQQSPVEEELMGERPERAPVVDNTITQSEVVPPEQGTPPTEQAPVIDTNTTKAQGITNAFDALGSGIDINARIKARNNLLTNTPQIFTKPKAIAAIKANPSYVVEDLADGSVRVVGVLDPDTNTWVGKQPTTQPLAVNQGGDVKYSMPLAPNQAKKSVAVADVSKIAREPVNNVISNITFGNQTLVNKEENVAKRTTVRGKEYNFNLYEYNLQDGRKRLVLSASDPENYVDAGAVIRFENNKPVIEMINADDNFENLGYNLTRQIIKRFGTPVKDESGSFSEIGAKHNAKLLQAESMPVAKEASMEEFEAVRKQFQERQKQETPFKNWFGKGTKDVTANADGTPITLYHGTNNPDFNQWDSSLAGDASGHPTSGLGFFMTANKGAAARYGNNLMALHAKIQNPYTLTDADLTSIETKEDANKLRKRLMAKGYDGAVVKAPGAKPYVIAFESKQVKFVTNEKPTDSPDFRYSMPEDNTQNIQEPAQESPTTEQTAVQEEKPLSNEQAPVTRSVTPAEFRANIDSIMGEGWIEQAENLGLINIVEGAGPRGESGSWIGNKILLYTDSMPTNGSPAGVLLHEGEHHTFTKLLGNSLPEYVKDLHTLADNGNKVARDAISHAAIITADMLGIEHNLRENGTKADLNAIRALIEQERPGLLAEEELAYFVQHGADAQTGTGFWRRLVNQIKAWFAQTRLGQRMKELGIGFEMTDGMAVEWAKMGLNQSLAELQQQQEAKTRVEKQFAAMPASVRLGNALVAIENVDPLFSLGIKEISDQLWNDPTDVRLEIVNKPGLLQRWRADFVDFFAEIEKKSKDIYDTYSLLRSKKAARIEQARQEYFISLRDMIANSPWTAEEVGDMLAARHIKIDKVNLELAKRASYNYTKELLKNLSAAKMKELQQARVHVKAGKMPDGSVYKDANGNPAQMSARTKQQLMFDLMNKYSQLEIPNAEGVQVLKEEWELFKDAASGFSDGGVGSSKVRVVGDILKLAEKDRAKFGQIATVFDAANRHTLELLEDGGLITTAEHARLLADKSAYAPLRRAAYNINEETTKLLQRAGQGGSKQINTRAGTENLSEPTLVLQNALASVEAAGAAAERNLANKELYKVIVADKEGWKPWFTIVDEEKYITHDEDGFLSEKNATATNRADIALINDGKRLIIRPNMHNGRAIGFVRAVNNLDAQEFSGPMKVLGWLNQITRWVNVNASPVFLMMNAFRDPLTALYNVQATEAGKYTKEIFSPKVYKESFKALKKVFLDGNRDPTDLDVQWVEKWELAGGRASFIDELRSMDTTWKSFNAQVARRQGNIFGTTVPGFKGLMEAKDKWIDGIENFNILFENVMRFSTFKVLMEHNAVSEKQAARISQDLTTNFTRRGYKTQALGAWWLFFHASVQGNYQVVRNLMTSKKLQALTGGTIVMALMLDLMGRAVDDDWDKIPENDKERFIIFPLKVGGKQVRVPAPWVYNVVWRAGGLLGEVLSQVKKPQDALLDLSALTMSAFSPIGKPGSIAQVVSPTGFDPFMQIIENKNFFGNPIGPEGFPGASKKANSELMWSSTPKGYQSFARFVNEATGGSAVESGMIDLKPGDYQVLANFLTGSLGRFLSDATFGLKEALDKEFEGGPRDIPVVKEFFSDPYDPLNAQKYHTNVAGIYGAHKLEQLYLKGPDRDLIKLQEVRENRGEELRMYAQAQDVERQLKSIRVRLRVAQNQGDYMREKELRDKMSKIQERFNEVYKRKIG